MNHSREHTNNGMHRQEFEARSPITRKSFSYIKSEADFPTKNKSLLEKYEKETEAVKFKRFKKQFKVKRYIAYLSLLMVKASLSN
jgi:hypothetical protein